ncbi:matrix metalloproteinase-16 [Nematostella vectensis]|uniref:matrix metalloproteinase-16 n=1 Tax=Nematostella vectensis TaxID=45351 RepID=UPI00207725F7|nr:matrix metalloproteinase-16 [Nematostella vectensis]
MVRRYWQLMLLTVVNLVMFSVESGGSLIGTRRLERHGYWHDTHSRERAAVEIQGHPRITNGDVQIEGRYVRSRAIRRRKRYALRGTQWHKKRITYQVMNAFSKWAAVTSLVFVRVPPTSRDADITIRFVKAGDHGDEKPFRKGITEQLVGHTFPPWNNTGRSGDIHFNDDKYFSLPGYARAAYDFLWIAMHEIGHSLGLAHTGDPFSVMYTTYTAYFYNRKRDLSADDIRGIQALYGPPLPSGIPNECAVTSLSAMVMTA